MTRIEGGYILLSRKLIESDIWDKPPIYLKVWLYILAKAQHKPYKNLDRGELVVSIPELIEVCSYKVGYRTEKPSKTQIFNVLEWLRSSYEGSHEEDAKEPMIETTKTTRGMVVKVLNYSVYQDPKAYERNGEEHDEEVTSGTMPERQADTINKNDKNDKNDKKGTQKQVFEETSDYFILAKYMVERIRLNNPDFKEPNLQKWSDDYRKILDIDKRDKKEVAMLIKWVQQDDFENVNVMSPSKLRKRYDQLAMKMRKELGTNPAITANNNMYKDLGGREY